jgi:hypothetical protein
MKKWLAAVRSFSGDGALHMIRLDRRDLMGQEPGVLTCQGQGSLGENPERLAEVGAQHRDCRELTQFVTEASEGLPGGQDTSGALLGL